MATSSPGLAHARDDEALEALKALLTAERAERRRLEIELDLGNCALDSAWTYFLILDVTGPELRIAYANRAVAFDHGFEQEQLLDKNPANLASPRQNRFAFARLRKAINQGNSARAELVSLHR